MRIPGLDSALRECRGVRATGLDREAVGTLARVRREVDDDATWQVVVTPETLDAVSTAFVLGTDVEALRRDGRLELFTSGEAAAERVLVAGEERALAVVGPEGDRTALVDTDPASGRRLREATDAWIERATEAAVDLPGRDQLLDSAAAELSDWFAEDLAGAIDGADRLRRDDPVDDRTLLLVVGARNDHLFHDVRVWAESVGIAPRQTFIDVRRDLVDRGLVEAIKLPMGLGHPHYRLRADDDALAACDAEELLPTLRERYGAAAGGTKTPAWEG